MNGTWMFTLIWLVLGLIFGYKSLDKPNSLIMFISVGCFLASLVAFLSAPVALQLIVFAASTIAILVIEEA